MKKLPLFFLLWLISLWGSSQNYSSSIIADSLKANAHSVVRLYAETYHVQNPGEAIHRIHSVVTVLDERGQKHATIAVGHDKFTKINDMEAIVYDAFGKQVKKMKRGDISDINYISNASLFEDDKLKVADLKYAMYPYTVEATYEVKTTNLLFYPSWSPQSSAGTSVENSHFEVIVPAEITLNYKLLNGISKPKITDLANGQKSYHWGVQNLPATAPEELAPALANLGPTVYTAPTVFEIQGRKGKMDTWQSLGKFHYELNKDRDVLPENIKQEVQKLVANETDIPKKVKKIYEYLQKNTRYISIQLGIGGWQAFEARTVADKGYGDCKALTNYGRALLKSVGITAYQALIRADGADQFADFPTSGFNHVILCVPTPKDTIWLECTSQTKAFGYLGDFTDDRYVLLLTPEGGRLVRTPLYQPADNLQVRTIEIKLEEVGNAIASIQTNYTGLQQDTYSSVLNQLNAEDQKEWLYKHIKIASFEIQSFKLSEQKSLIPAVKEQLALLIKQYASKSGNRIFINPNLMNIWRLNLPSNIKRKSAIEWENGFIDTDSVRLILPTGYKAEFVPASTRIESKFGKYEINIEIKEGEIHYCRRMFMPKGIYPPGFYTEMAGFFKKVTKADKSQLVLVKKE